MATLRLLLFCLLLAGCAAPAAAPASPLAAPWGASPLVLRPRAARTWRVALPVVEGAGFTQHCTALDGGRGEPAHQVNAGEGRCFHIWWSPSPLPDGLWPACRSVAECKALDVAGILKARPGATFLLLNEPQNQDVAGGGWPESPEHAARELAPVVQAIRKGGGVAYVGGLYVDAADNLRAADWWRAYRLAGGLADGVHFHVFTNAASVPKVLRYAEAQFPGVLIVSESGWDCGVTRAVQGIDEARYAAVFTLASAACQ